MSEKERQLLKSIKEKITTGLPVAFERMWKEARERNYRMAILKDNKVVIVNAAELK
ncbi:MAG: hypothetical protein KIS94_01465 [Chitinophagales bacterium]|nr:hypothetical protein [Chitinophagales bacterium]